jgi:hypothetical protein
MQSTSHRVVLTFPVLPGKSAADVRLISTEFQARPEEYAESRRRLGIMLERAYLQQTPMGSFVVAYWESQHPQGETIALMASSTLPIDKFFTDTAREVHGFDLSQPPDGPPPETIGEWFDPAVTTRGPGMAFTAPLLPGVEDAGRAFVADAYAREDFARSRREKHTYAEVATLAHTPDGEIVSVYVEGEDPWAGNRAFAASDDPFDVWFKAQLRALFPPFIDFSKPVEGVTEIFDSQRQLQAI